MTTLTFSELQEVVMNVRMVSSTLTVSAPNRQAVLTQYLVTPSVWPVHQPTTSFTLPLPTHVCAKMGTNSPTPEKPKSVWVNVEMGSPACQMKIVTMAMSEVGMVAIINVKSKMTSHALLHHPVNVS